MSETIEGAVLETYAAALQHDIADLPADATRVGVVRRPTGWFRALVDANWPALGPPEPLLDETKERQEELGRRGLCEEEAHNAAWEAVDFETRYRDHLETDADAGDAIAELTGRVEHGETVALVCFEGENKRCHRRILVDELRNRVSDAG